MAKKDAPTSGPLLHVRDWLTQQTGLPVESAAGFVRHVAQDVWDTAEGWASRWATWLQHRV